MSIDITKRKEDIYKLIENTLIENNSEFIDQFHSLVELRDDNAIFFWLQDKSLLGKLPSCLEPLITDLFYLIH